jgi:hypothetical protein
MNIEQVIIKNLRKLPLEKPQEVLSFTESLIPKTSPPFRQMIVSLPRKKLKNGRK